MLKYTTTQSVIHLRPVTCIGLVNCVHIGGKAESVLEVSGSGWRCVKSMHLHKLGVCHQIIAGSEGSCEDHCGVWRRQPKMAQGIAPGNIACRYSCHR